MNINIENTTNFVHRHNGSDATEIKKMLKAVNTDSLDSLMQETIPEKIRIKKKLNFPASGNEYQFLNDFKKLADQNKVFRSYIGMGYNNCVTPSVIKRNILENPGWYTAYTPYQAEIAQGRLEALINFQTMIIDLTGMEIANASLLDEATAAAEAMIMMYNVRKGNKLTACNFFISKNCHPQTIDVLKSRSNPLKINLIIGEHQSFKQDESFFGALLQYPNTNGSIFDYSEFISKAHSCETLVAVAADLLSLTILKTPAEMGADIAVGTTQRFGVPMCYGGPHAAYFATKEIYKRSIPGRIIGISVDAQGNPAYRMALQTREQHIRREKATSNICTSQVLLAVMAGMYALYHGPRRLKDIAGRIHGLCSLLNDGLNKLGYKQTNEFYFDTLKVAVDNKSFLKEIALEEKINFRYFDDGFAGISLDETTDIRDVHNILKVFAKAINKEKQFDFNKADKTTILDFPDYLLRKSNFLTNVVFNVHHSETEMLRYIKQLENKDLSLVHSMISLGSCTMKLNATSEMIPVTWAEFCDIHPFAPIEQTKGYFQLFADLEKWLCDITGFVAVSLQPNSGAQGEYAGLLVIQHYHKDNGQGHRDVVLIPSSAHGTNPASAVMAGLKVIIIKCDQNGNINLADLEEKAKLYKDKLSALMITYPSTHGVFEEDVVEICKIIHTHGGQVYMDGANMNAQVGLTNPAMIGADVCHLNLHKTFCIPHGGGGPGMGPICVASHLAPYLSGHAVVKTGGSKAMNAVSAAPWSSAGILPISYAYISMMGGEGLTLATKIAILNANYLKCRLQNYYDILYVGKNGRVAHEMIVDCRKFKLSTNIEVEDIAKRLMDYGFHAPTVSFPVPGTLMIEPTESESKAELDRFCEAMISIRKEIQEIEDGIANKENNVLKNAPHTASVVTADVWNHTYSREKAAYPAKWLNQNKFWPTAGRIDNAYGDRNLICSCAPAHEYAQSEEVIV